MQSFACLLPAFPLLRSEPRGYPCTLSLSDFLTNSFPGGVSGCKALGGVWRVGGRLKPGVSPASLSVLTSGTCSRSSESPPHQSALLLCFQFVPGSLALAMAMPSPAPSLQPRCSCGFHCCDSLGYLTILSSLLDFHHCMKFAALNCPSGGCFSEWALSSTDVLRWRCSYETLEWGCSTGSHIHRWKAAVSAVGWRQVSVVLEARGVGEILPETAQRKESREGTKAKSQKETGRPRRETTTSAVLASRETQERRYCLDRDPV